MNVFMTTYFAAEVGLAKSTSARIGNPVHGTAIDQASTQRCRYSRSSSGMRRIRSSIAISSGFSTSPSIFTVQGRGLSASEPGVTVFEVENS